MNLGTWTAVGIGIGVAHGSIGRVDGPSELDQALHLEWPPQKVTEQS